MSYRQCSAKSKRTGERCRGRCVSGRDVCYHHGGRSLRGINSPSFKSGIYSADLNGRLAVNYQELMQLGERLFRLDDETAVIVALAQSALARIADGESGAAWRKARALVNEMLDINRKHEPTEADVNRFTDILTELDGIFNDQAMSYAARDEAADLLDRKRKFVADERRHQIAQHEAMTFDRVMLLVVAVIDSFKQALARHAEKEQAAAILAEAQAVVDKALNGHVE